MAAGDEKVDVFDQVALKNRLTDGQVEIQFDGRFYRWAPGEVRRIPRAYREHFLQKATYKWDPTETNFPSRTLVWIDEDGKAVEQGASAEPLTLAQTKVLDLIDDEHLPDRYFDEQTGAPLRNKEGRMAGSEPRHFAGRGVRTRPAGHAVSNEALDEAAEAAARAQV